MQEHHLKVQRTARYYTIGTPGAHVKRLWLVAHGYGQAAKKFVNKFSDLDDGQTLIVAPEALSRFYFGGFTGEVGGSWMTREDRLNEIDDYINYLTTVFEHFRVQLPDSVRVTLFGFSQGGVTLCRWMMRYRPSFHHLILWASDVPKDVDFLSGGDYLDDKELYHVLGTKDEFLTPERIAPVRAFVESQELDLNYIFFEGKHRVDRNVLNDLAVKLS